MDSYPNVRSERMRIYHFLNEEFGLKDLREKRLMISNIMELNDPFEFFFLETSDRNFRESIKAGKKSAAKQFGVICFSANWKNPVQWSHYANRHKGICLGFDVPIDCLEKVTYVNERVHHNGELNISDVMELMKTKYIDWKYEEEYRAFIELKEDENGIYYSDFSDNLKLKRVVVGAESKLTRKDVDAALGDLSPDVEVFKARPAFKKFEITKNKNEKLWT